MSTWNKLSMAERAEIMKLAIQGGVYDLDAIRNGYNEFAGGGAVTNEISEDYQPLVSDSYQSIMDSMKASDAGFNVDDYAYRVQKMHPEITREQVQSLYNATPYIASDKVKGVTEGGFRAGDSTGYGRRVTLYPEAHYRNTGTKITPANANAEMGDTMTHETNHLYTDVLLGGTNDAEGDLLWDAYRPGLVVQDPNFNGEYSEERAINAGIRNRISRENGNVIGEELDKAIDNTPDDVLMNMLFDPNNGYINQSGKKHMQDKNGNWNRTDAVRKALKDVAFNQIELPDNYAAFGGPLVQAANEFAEGGDTEKPYVYYKDKEGNLVDYSYGDYELAVDAANRWRELKENGHPYYLEPQNVLPEVTVTGYRPIELKTYYPLSKEYPLTGHSELYIPITNDVADDYELRTHEDVANNKSIALDIDKLSTSKDYNLLLNNCADSTLGYLNKMFGTSESPTFFTTPGDVRDFAIDTLNGKVINKDGVETVIIPRNKRNADVLSKRAIELWNKNLDEGNGFIDYQHSLGGPIVEAANEYKHGGGIHIKKENRGKFTRLKERTGHSASWFKEHGTPAQKKMAVFALNSRKWKH